MQQTHGRQTQCCVFFVRFCKKNSYTTLHYLRAVSKVVLSDACVCIDISSAYKKGQRESLFSMEDSIAWLGCVSPRTGRRSHPPHPFHPKGLVGGRVDEIDFSLSFDSPMCGIAVMFKCLSLCVHCP